MKTKVLKYFRFHFNPLNKKNKVSTECLADNKGNTSCLKLSGQINSHIYLVLSMRRLVIYIMH